MIRPLCQRHRALIIALSVIVPLAFAFGVSTRREIPVTPTGDGQSQRPAKAAELWSGDDLWAKRTITTRLLRDEAEPQGLSVELSANEPIVRPDMLVYWTSQKGAISNSLPDEAYLLGSFDQAFPTHLKLPPQASNQPGALILYSLGEHEIVAVSKPLSVK